MINELFIGKVMKGRVEADVRFCSGIYLEELGNTAEYLSGYSLGRVRSGGLEFASAALHFFTS